METIQNPLNKYLIEISDLNREKFVETVRQFSKQNKDFRPKWDDWVTVTVVTDCSRQELSQKWDIPIGKIVENRRVRVSEHLVFVVKDEQLLKGKNFGTKTPKIPTGGKDEVKIKTETMSKSREKYHVPQWNPGPEGLRSYIDMLDNAKTLGYFESDADLIYSSLCRSGKPEIYSQLTQTEKDSLAEYAKYLNTNYGRSLNEKKRRFNLLRQEENEDENSWFIRVIREYWSAKGSTRPANEAFTSENKADISLAFLAGLRRNDLKRIMKLHLDDTDDENADFFQIGKRAQRKALSLRELEGQVYSIGGQAGHSGVFNVDMSDVMPNNSSTENTESPLQAQINQLCNQVRQLKTGQNDKSKKKCFQCGLFGHFQAECRASTKNKRAFNRKKNNNPSHGRRQNFRNNFRNYSGNNSRNSFRGRSRSRDFSRGQSRSFRNNRSRSFNRSASRDRYSSKSSYRPRTPSRDRRSNSRGRYVSFRD